MCLVIEHDSLIGEFPKQHHLIILYHHIIYIYMKSRKNRGWFSIHPFPCRCLVSCGLVGCRVSFRLSTFDLPIDIDNCLCVFLRSVDDTQSRKHLTYLTSFIHIPVLVITRCIPHCGREKRSVWSTYLYSYTPTRSVYFFSRIIE